MARERITIHAKLRGVMHGVGHAGERILEAHGYLKSFEKYIPEGVERKLFLNVLSTIEAQAQELKTTADE
jgi:hypothetical protein